ncbi:hypothetical protein UA08_01025 [Talaromyces atroroseus]|uniref:Zn(2)-C6 fungal-type domain-containing protein n=1 Tax=Talaromyces atroroseus TaxID=1441469 RepID=A0A225B0I9_TALAT|nr:hypothetical protein UA08_01025 [Talaromyces atroroseus]OKL64224.1 hypothetical protein UA08_01025 [Talaromyces atroroseus]
MTTTTDVRTQATIARSPSDRSRACANCVRAKTRCSFVSEAETKCERCRRMRKDCQPQPAARKRKVVTRHAPNKVERLEEKIDGLVDFLRSTAESGLASANSNTSSVNTVVPRDSALLRPGNAVSSNVPRSINHEEPAFNPTIENNISRPSLTLSSSSNPASAPVGLLSGIDTSPEPSAETAELYLLNFRENFIKNLPFLVIPPSVTAYSLRQERPILWLCIMTVASNSSNQQIALSRKARELFGKVAYVEAIRNMDLLLGILVLVTWYETPISFTKPNSQSNKISAHFDCLGIDALALLAISTVYDLDLDKAPSTDMGFVLHDSVKGATNITAQSSRYPTMEERRALLGCYLLSTVSSSLRKGQSLRWTSYFDDCLRVLQDTKENESDETLVQIVKLRQVSDKVVDYSRLGEGPSEGIPATFYVKSLRSELHESVTSIPSNLPQNKILLLEQYYTEASIHEIGFSQSSRIFVEQPTLRFECLFACLQAIKSFCETLLSIPSHGYPGFSSLVLAAMTTCFTRLCRLSMCEYLGWDRDIVHATIDVSFFLEQLEKKYRHVRETVGIESDDSHGGNDYFTIKATKLRAMRESWDALTLPAMSVQELESLSTDFLDAWTW